MNVLYAFGGIIVILAMGFLLALSYTTMGGTGIFVRVVLAVVVAAEWSCV